MATYVENVLNVQELSWITLLFDISKILFDYLILRCNICHTILNCNHSDHTWIVNQLNLKS